MAVNVRFWPFAVLPVQVKAAVAFILRKAPRLRIPPRLFGLRGAPVDGSLREREAGTHIGEHHAHASADADRPEEIGWRQLAVGKGKVRSVQLLP